MQVVCLAGCVALFLVVDGIDDNDSTVSLVQRHVAVLVLLMLATLGPVKLPGGTIIAKLSELHLMVYLIQPMIMSVGRLAELCDVLDGSYPFFICATASKKISRNALASSSDPSTGRMTPRGCSPRTFPNRL